jgi:hypothetical protein
MRLAMTLMVRDEIDIISSMIDHHVAQGVDVFIVTDNGSIDGTYEHLTSLIGSIKIDLRQDFEQRKQQSECVSQMARDAHVLHGADWVINADADEFWVTQNRNITLREAFERISPAIQSFTVPVTNMIGLPALSGSGLQRLIYPDRRTVHELEIFGLPAPPTHNAVHIGSADVEVSQGNHIVSLESLGRPAPDFDIEVLHYPWRSWRQFSKKVESAGTAYDSNPDKSPSPNHHGMKDFSALKDGTLLSKYLSRSLATSDFHSSSDYHWEPDPTIAKSFPSSIRDEEFSEDIELIVWNSRMASLREHVFALDSELLKSHLNAEALSEELSRYSASRLIQLAKRISRHF